MTDPWSVHIANTDKIQVNSANDSKDINNKHTASELDNCSQYLGFEDSFIQDNNSNAVVEDGDKIILEENRGTEHQPLPDSEKYLQSLEHKLEKLKKSSKLVDALAEKRNDCLRSILQNDSSYTHNNDLLLELEASVTNSDSAVQNLYRQIQPIQPVTVGETVQIVKYDQLEEQRLQAEANEELEENLPASR